MQTSICAELAAEAMGRLPGEIRANRRDLPLQGVHDVALRIELQGRIELHVQHLSPGTSTSTGLLGQAWAVLQLLRPHSDLAGAGGGAVPAPQLGALQRVIHGATGACTAPTGDGRLPAHVSTWAVGGGLVKGLFGVYIAKLRGKCRGGRKKEERN